MASVTHWKDIAEKFCVCAICLEYIKEPKQLACLHRFCKHCLNVLIQDAHGIFLCPECREEIEVPTEGVDGFRTDFHTRNLVEYVQIQQTLKRDELRNCYGCTNLLKVEAYCFKCNDFLCASCYTFHMKNNTLKDHRQHTLSIDDAESNNVTMKKLGSLRDAPRCQAHPDKLSDLCCETCHKLPICTSCTYGEHKGHNCFEIKAFAKSERERASSAMQFLENVKQDKLAVSPDEIIQDLNSYAANETTNLEKKYEDEAQKLNSQLSNVSDRKEKMEAHKNSIKQETFSSLRDEMDKEVQQIKEKYEQLITEKGKEIDDDFKNKEYLLAKEFNKLSRELKQLDKVKDNLKESIAMQVTDQVDKVEKISEPLKNARKRFDNLKSKVSDILDSENDWMAALCISGICNACDKLIEDIKRLPDLATMNKMKLDIEQITLLEDVNINISKKELFSSTIEFMKGFWIINDVTSSNNVIVITGEHYIKKLSIIIVVDQNGSLMRHDTFKKKSTFHSRFCEFLSDFKVASVCQPNDIGIYDVRDGSYTSKDLFKISRWPSGCDVLCIARDPLNNNIFVGGYSRNVYVFDDKLSHLYIITLPTMVTSVDNMTVHKSNVIICDHETKRAYEVTAERSKTTNTSELANPDVGKVKLKPTSVCTDSNGFIYLLWTSDKIFGRSHHVLTQYSRDRRLIEERHLDQTAACISIRETDDQETLLVAYGDSFEVYGLLHSAPKKTSHGTSS